MIRRESDRTEICWIWPVIYLTAGFALLASWRWSAAGSWGWLVLPSSFLAYASSIGFSIGVLPRIDRDC